MTKRLIILCVGILLMLIIAPLSSSQAGEKPSTPLKKGPKHKLKDPIKSKGQTGFCIDCHREVTPGIFEDWINSEHAGARDEIGCQDCHSSSKGEPDAILHAEKFYIRTVVTPFVCAKCHKDIMRDYFTSGHAQALEVLKNIKEDDPRYPIIAQYKDDDFKQCSGCHGSVVTFNEDHTPDAATWPNSGAGRINANRSHGNCSSCHIGHRFSVAAARQPATCIRCHDGKHYPEGEIYSKSPHGVAYQTLTDKKVLEQTGYYLDAKKMVSPTCSFCHFNGSGHGLLTRHNGAWRLPRDLTHPQAPLAPKRADNLRNNMKSVCNQCHASPVIDRFFENADNKLEDYQKNVVEPEIARYLQQLEKTEGEEHQKLLNAYSDFLAESKRYRMNLYMGEPGHLQR